MSNNSDTTKAAIVACAVCGAVGAAVGIAAGTVLLQKMAPEARKEAEPAAIGAQQRGYIDLYLFNYETGLKAVMEDGNNLKYLNKNLRNDWRIVRAAVLQNGLALQWAILPIENDDILLAAVTQNGWALQWANDRQRNDNAIVSAAMKATPWALQYASNRIADKAFAGDPSVWQYLTETQRDVIRVLFKLRNLLEGGDLSLEPSALPSSVLK